MSARLILKFARWWVSIPGTAVVGLGLGLAEALYKVGEGGD
jgi:hypothetical protein